MSIELFGHICCYILIADLTLFGTAAVLYFPIGMFYSLSKTREKND